MHARFGPIRQIAYVVDDLDRSILHWMQFAGIGPWTVYRNTALQGCYREAATRVRIHVGLSYRDDVQIELIQVVSQTPSPYQDATGRSLIGMHHIAQHSRDLDADVAAAHARGLHTAFTATNGVVRVAYMESRQEPGLLLEFIEAVPEILDGFSAGVAASRKWGGRGAAIQTFDLGG